MIACIYPVTPPVYAANDDRWLWRHGYDDFNPTFSRNRTRNKIREQRQTVSWSSLVWFPQVILRMSFITWLTFRDRLSTWLRTHARGITDSCYLCGKLDETRDHLFFAYRYSFIVCIDLEGSLLGSRVDPDWTITVETLISYRTTAVDICLLKLLL